MYVCTEIEVKYTRGFVSLSVPLPSRRERCVFTFLAATQTVADLITQLEHEDKGTDHVAVYSLGISLAYMCYTTLNCQFRLMAIFFTKRTSEYWRKRVLQAIFT